MIQTKSLEMTYPNGFKAVNGLDLTVGERDIFGFLGPNGAGKTTTLRMLTGLLKPTHGSVSIDSIDPQKAPLEVKKKIGILPESHGFYNSMNAIEYLTYFAKLYQIPKKEYVSYIRDLLNKVGLSEKTGVPIGQYSRGMRQRLGIAKTLIHKPQIIFLDEPTLGLDPIDQRDIHELILEINREMNVTVLITSHLLKDIEILCNKVCIVKSGILLEQGSINDLKDKYKAKLGMETISIEDIFFHLTEDKEVKR